MAAVNWDQSSEGVVSSPKPALTLVNDKDGGLVTESEAVAVTATSKTAEAIKANTGMTLTGRFISGQFTAIFAYAPAGAATVGLTYSKTLPGILGASLPDPKIPSISDNLGGVGVLGFTTRFAATATMGLATGPRSVGILGNAQGTGVRGIGTSSGVEGFSSGGDGVQGVTQDPRSFGIYGYAPGPDGAGVLGRGLAGPGVDAHSQAGPAVRAASDQAEGVLARATAPNAAGVRSSNDNSAGFAVDASSNAGTALRGTSSSGTGLSLETISGRAAEINSWSKQPAIDVYSPQAPGMSVLAIGAIGISTLGNTGIEADALANPDPTNPKVGTGAFGFSFTGTGVCGATLNGAGVVGIGFPQLNAWAGVFKGNVRVEGAIFKYASLFSIDHPLDPDRMRLNHAAVECPEYKTFYDGRVTLDPRGKARVRLPKWFGALNGELRYQLTPLGRAAPDLHVAQEVRNCVFHIAGGAPGQKICWQITGLRRDRWARENPLMVEQPRQGFEPSVANPRVADLKRMAEVVRTDFRKMKRERDKQLKAARSLAKAKNWRPPAPRPTNAPKSPAGLQDALLSLIKRLERTGRSK
jgi:hypothetical protein